MFQVPLAFTGEGQLRADLRALAGDNRVAGASAVLVSLFTDTVDEGLVAKFAAIVADELPSARLCGCSMNGGIVHGMLDDSRVFASCMVFEDPGTRLDLVQLDLRAGTVEAARAITRAAAERPWTKVLGLLATSGSVEVTPFCRELDRLDPRVQVVGGGACDRDISDDPGCVFSSAGATGLAEGAGTPPAAGFSRSGVVAVFLGGPELRVTSARVSGWQPLGRELRVTSSAGTVVREFNGAPAFDVYSHYLKIDNGAGFYSNALEFPLLFEAPDGMQIPHVPVRAGRQGELQLAVAVPEGAVAHIAYGDPESIQREVEDAGSLFADMDAQAIFAFGCAARRKFWGDEDCSDETLPLDTIAPTMGFYTGGEFYRAPSGKVHFNNTTIVLAGLREGRAASPGKGARPPLAVPGHWMHRRLSVVHRMANFVNVAVADLERANARLAELAAADPLTGLLNRGEIERRIERALVESRTGGFPVSMLMLDIDDYKHVNDQFGHQRGDSLLRSLSHLMSDIMRVMAPGASLGRWGGDEFMILLAGMDIVRAREVAEALRASFAAIDLGTGVSQTISVGVVQARPGDDADVLCSRADERLYEAKREGKNRVRG